MGKTYRRLPTQVAMEFFLEKKRNEGLIGSDVTDDQMKTVTKLFRHTKNIVTEDYFKAFKNEFGSKMKNSKKGKKENIF